jgi:hypothetical protein
MSQIIIEEKWIFHWIFWRGFFLILVHESLPKWMKNIQNECKTIIKIIRKVKRLIFEMMTMFEIKSDQKMKRRLISNSK